VSAVWFLAWAALAQEPVALEVTVEKPPARPAAKADPPWAGTLVVGRGPIVVDGRVDEAAWAGASAPPLGPYADGGASPAVSVRAVWADDGLAVAIIGLSADHTASVLVHPDGLFGRWWIATVGATTGWVVCDYGAPLLPIERAVSPDAAACRPVEGVPIAGVDGTFEVALPESAGASYTTLGRLDVVVTGPKGAGGRWGPGGREPQPGGGLLLAPDAGVAVRTTVDLDQARLHADVTLPAGSGPWRWRFVYRDLVLAEGALENGTIDTDMPRLERLGVVVDAPTATVPRPAGLRWTAYEYAATLATPVFADEVAIAVRASVPVAAAPVVVLDDAGATLGTATVAIPAGQSMVRITVPPAFPAVLRVRVGGLADVTTLRGAP